MLRQNSKTHDVVSLLMIELTEEVYRSKLHDTATKDLRIYTSLLCDMRLERVQVQVVAQQLCELIESSVYCNHATWRFLCNAEGCVCAEHKSQHLKKPVIVLLRELLSVLKRLRKSRGKNPYAFLKYRLIMDLLKRGSFTSKDETLINRKLSVWVTRFRDLGVSKEIERFLGINPETR